MTRRGLPVRMLARVWEYQQRGVLHVHGAFDVSTPAARAGYAAYVREVDRLRRSFGFGFVDRKRSVREPAHAGRYLAKYLAKRDGGGGLVLSETVTRADVPGHVVHIGRPLTARTRVTMRTLRMRRLAWVISQQPGHYDMATVLELLLGERPTAELLIGQGVESLPPPRGA